MIVKYIYIYIYKCSSTNVDVFGQITSSEIMNYIDIIFL